MRKPRQKLKQFSEAVFSAVAPPRCMGCLRENDWLCSSCRQNIDKPHLTCVVCAKSAPGGVACKSCREDTALRGAVYAGAYGNPLFKRGIHWLKFRGVTPVADELANLVVDSLSPIAPMPELQERAVLVPTPLHWLRERKRGFDQSLVLAEKLGGLSDIPVVQALRRKKATVSQTRMRLQERADNVMGVFTLQAPLPDRPIVLLLDDVTTTGSTLSAMAAALQEKYPEKQYWAVTVARG